MSGIYIHIPFCKKACIYCDFHFSTSLARKGELVDAICEEVSLRKSYLTEKEIETIYFGGGTPSLLSEKELQQIFEHLTKTYSIKENAEITLEANPDDLTVDKLKVLEASPVNRLSIGIQSFDDEDLKLMNRSHDAKQAESCVQQARDFGFENLSIDLIYGIPGRNESHWKRQLQKAINLNVPHISGYALTVEKETILENWIRKGRLAPVDEAAAEKQFHILSETLQNAGYGHYEISNFAKPKKRALHNSNYWNQTEYMGLGPSAHSFDGKSRQWNVSNNHLYINALQSGDLNFEKENLSVADRFNETVMTKLRTLEGLDLHEIDQQFGAEYSEYLVKESSALIQTEQLEMGERKLQIPAHRRFYSDGIAASLFYV